MIELALEEESNGKCNATIRVIGVGGAGSNAVNSMVTSKNFSNINFVVANTDLQALKQSPTPNKIQLGAKITKGLGAGSNPELGKMAAEEDLETISEHLLDTDILFLTAGLGGGTGTGALPVIVNAAKELGILTIVIVTKPFLFEGHRRLKFAEDAIKFLQESADTLIVVPNQKLLEISDPKISMLDAFSKSNDILNQAIKGISDIIAKPGHINVDFADVRTIMTGKGMALMGIGRASGQNRAQEAAMAAINSPLLEYTDIRGAKGILINITGNSMLGLHEICAATNFVSEMVSPEANIIFGTVIDESMGDEVAVTVIATGFNANKSKELVDVAVKIVAEKETKSMPEKNVADTILKNDDLLECAIDVREGRINTEDIDTPTFLRKKAAELQ